MASRKCREQEGLGRGEVFRSKIYFSGIFPIAYFLQLHRMHLRPLSVKGWWLPYSESSYHSGALSAGD